MCLQYWPAPDKTDGPTSKWQNGREWWKISFISSNVELSSNGELIFIIWTRVSFLKSAIEFAERIIFHFLYEKI